MKRRSRLILPLAAFSLLFGVAAGLTACGGQQQTSEQETIKITAEGGKNKLILNETVQLTAKAGDKELSGITWSSSETSIATVSATGLVEGKAVGKAVIKAEKKGYKDGQITINVDLPKITITPSSGSIKMDETLTLQADQQGVTWSSSDENVATVSDAGVVTGVYVGSAQISASKDGFNAGKATITVTRPDALATLSFDDADHYSADGWWGTADEGYLPNYARNSGNASGSSCLAHFGTGDKETLTFTSTKTCNAELVIMMAASSAISDMQSIMTAKLNGTAINLTNKSFAGGSTSEFTEFSLGTHEISKDHDNVLLLEFVADDGTPYIDDLVLYSKNANGAQVATKPASPKEQITVQLEENKTSLEAYIGVDVQIQLTKPTSLDGVTFESDKETVATVGQTTGLVRGVALGTANVTIKKQGWISARIEVVVDKATVPGEIRVEAENHTNELPEGFHKWTDRTTGIENGHSGSAYITGYGVNSACKLEYEFTSDKNQTMTLVIAGASHYQMDEAFNFARDCVIKLNGSPITVNPDAQIESNKVMGAPTVEVTIGDVNVIKDTNTFVIEFIDRAPALDCYRFLPKTVA